MKYHTWNDVKKLAEHLQVFHTKLKNSNLVLFGAGRSGSCAYEEIKKQYLIYRFCDNNEKAWGGYCEGVLVIPPKQLKTIEPVFVILTVTGQACFSIKKQLDDMEISYITYMEYILIQNYEKFEWVYHQLEDECSKKTYLYILLSYLTSDMTYLKKIFVKNQYFEIPEFYMLSSDEVFVDCGAYTGDTLEQYINIKAGTFKKIYSFEPTEKMVHALQIRKDRLVKEWALEAEQIIIEKKMLAEKSGIRYFMESVQDGKQNRMGKEEQIESKPIPAVSLDEYFADKNEKPTFIKADIEGSEIELLKGAKKIITEKKPLLAICIYHRAEDFYEIPRLLKQFCPEYKMSIRHHMPNYYETVLYCYL